MSHRNDCPDPYIAEREGRRAGEDGYRSRYSNPYMDECEEASDRWDKGFRSGVRIRQEREEEEHLERLARERQYQEEQFEREYFIQQDFSTSELDYSAMAQEYYEEQYQLALADDLHLDRILLAYETIALEAIQ